MLGEGGRAINIPGGNLPILYLIRLDENNAFFPRPQKPDGETIDILTRRTSEDHFRHRLPIVLDEVMSAASLLVTAIYHRSVVLFPGKSAESSQAE